MTQHHDSPDLGTAPSPYDRLTVSPLFPSLLSGENAQMSAIGRLSTGASVDVTDLVTWSSSDEQIATVDQDGGLVARAEGSVEIAAVIGGSRASTVVTVSAAPSSGYLFFKWVVVSDSSDFFVTIPVTQADDSYAVSLALPKCASCPRLMAPNETGSDRTTTQLRVIASALLRAGDEVDVLLVA